MNAAKSVSLHPYFKVNAGKLDDFKALLPQFIEKTSSESGCVYYGFTICDDVIFCREGYINGESVLAHLENVGELLGKGLEISEIVRFEIHGPESELDKLREPLAHLNADFFIHQCAVEK